MYDFITIGSATIDAFIDTNTATVVSVATIADNKEFMAYPYGAKIEIDDFKNATGGGAVNTATNFANLGFKTSAIIKIGKELQGQSVIKTLEQFGVATSDVIISKTEQTGFSVILTSFQGDRTVLAHRGPNATMTTDEINFDAIKNSKWLYIAPLNGDSTKMLDKIAEFAEKNDVNMAINIGTSSIKQGADYLNNIIKTAEVVILNKDEATMLTGIKVRPDTKDTKYSGAPLHEDIKSMLNELKSTNAEIVIITDGKAGAYAYDGKNYYIAPEFPAKVMSTLGAGDAFSSTFVASLEKTNWDVEKSLMYASVNAAATVEKFGAQEGFLTFDKIEEKLKNTPEYKITKLP